MVYVIYFLSTISTLLFLTASCFHVYWAFGGKWVSEAVLTPPPTDGTLVLKPNQTPTLIIAAMLLLFAFVSSGNWGLYRSWFSDEYVKMGNWVFFLLFSWRAMGDFKLIGFTKRIKGTAFAEMDTRILSPLCLLIAVISLLTAYLN